MTDWREVNRRREYTEDDLLRIGKQSLAMRRVSQALKNGTLAKQHECEVCGSAGTTVAHHWRGYDFPFDVWWVCRKCNASIPFHNGLSIERVRAYLFSKRYEPLVRSDFARWEATCFVCTTKDERRRLRAVEFGQYQWYVVCERCYMNLTGSETR